MSSQMSAIEYNLHTRTFFSGVVPKIQKNEQKNYNFTSALCAGSQSAPINFATTDIFCLAY